MGPRPQAAVDLGNAQLRFALSLISLCRSMGVPVYLENPGTSWVWSTPKLRALVTASDATVYNLDMCAFGARWRKFTKVACWARHHPEAPQIARCCGRQGFCSFSGKPHIVLTGVDPLSGILWTRLAEPYPVRFCNCFSGLIANQTGFQGFKRMVALACPISARFS